MSRTSWRCRSRWSGTARCFALNVRGDSLIDAAICDGNLVVQDPGD
jgi:SOS-response transcriptional repressor LexA